MEQFSHDLTLALEETSRSGGVRAGRWGLRRRTRSTGNLRKLRLRMTKCTENYLKNLLRIGMCFVLIFICFLFFSSFFLIFQFYTIFFSKLPFRRHNHNKKIKLFNQNNSFQLLHFSLFFCFVFSMCSTANRR